MAGESISEMIPIYLLPAFAMFWRLESFTFPAQALPCCVLIQCCKFVTSAGIAVTRHKVLTLHIIFPQAVDDDMHMDVAAPIMAVRVDAGKQRFHTPCH